MNHELVIESINVILPLIVGAILGAIGAFGSGFVKEYFARRERIATHKRNVAREVHKLCIEASTGSFKISPRNREHVNHVMTDLDGIDAKEGSILNRFVALWVLIVDEVNKDKKNASQDDYAYFKGLLDEVEEKRKILVKWENKVRVG